MNIINRLQSRFVLAIATAVCLPLATLADLPQRMVVVGNPEVVVRSDRASGVDVNAFCIDFTRKEPTGLSDIGHHNGDVGVWQSVDGQWVYRGNLQWAVGNQIISINGVNRPVPPGTLAAGRYDTIRITPGTAASGTYCVKFNSGAVFGETAADVQAGRDAVAVVNTLNRYGATNRLSTLSMQRAYWTLEQSGRATLTEVEALTQLSSSEFESRIATLAASLPR